MVSNVSNIEVHEVTLKLVINRDIEGNPGDWAWADLLEIDQYHDECGVEVVRSKLVNQYTVNND